MGIFNINGGVLYHRGSIIYDIGRFHMTVGVLYIMCLDLAVHEVFSVSNENETTPLMPDILSRNPITSLYILSMFLIG